MLEQLKYQNHLNEVFEFGKDGIFVNTNDLHDYAWSVTQSGGRISEFTRQITTKTLPIVILRPCNQPYEYWGTLFRNKLFEVTEKDVLAKQPGKIIIGDYYMRCYVTKSQKKNYQTSRQWMEANLTLVTDCPVWIKESSTPFFGKTDIWIDTEDTDIWQDFAPFSAGAGRSVSRVAGGNLDYPIDFPHDYASGLTEKTIKNNALSASDFKLTIWGGCVDPYVFVGGHLYKVNYTLQDAETLTIDSMQKKIYVTHDDGTTTNVFRFRERSSYIFEKIPVGSSHVSWSGDFSFQITLFEERSEPLWI